MSEILVQALKILITHWGHKKLRPAQAKVIEYASAGEDVLAVLPTSYGKSSMFQIPAVMFEGSALVVSPLIALMKDQVDDCIKRGIPASFVNSHVTDKEQTKRFKEWIDGKYKVFYIAPERIVNAQFISALSQANVSFIVLDESHCASIWGHDFRPAYLRIRDITQKLNPRPPVLAFTATATIDVVKDIAHSVGLREDHKRVVADPVRTNLNYQVSTDSPRAALLRMCRTWNPNTGRYVVYVGTQKKTVELAQFIQSNISYDQCVGFYHGGMKPNERTHMQESFKNGTLPIMVATNAFGMGIDVPNIRTVVHYGIPGSLENYVQESGRAGRDGLPSDVVLLLDEDAIWLQQQFINWNNPQYVLYQLVWRWLNANVSPEEILMVGDYNLAEKIGNIGMRDLGAVLRTMAAYHIIERSPVPYGTSAHANLNVLRKFATRSTAAPDSVHKTAKACWDLYVLPVTQGKPQANLEFGLDRSEVAETAGISKSSVGTALTAISDAGGWELSPIDYTRTTRVVRHGMPLNAVLPVERIEAKRKRDQTRLDCMIEYTNLQSGHTQFIRDYFLGSEGGEI